MSADAKIIVVSDTHISVRSDPSQVARFCEFLRCIAGQGAAACGTVVIAGDLFNLDILDSSTDGAGKPEPRGRLAAILARFPELENAFAGLLDAGIDVKVLPGNHDVELLAPEVADMFHRAILRRTERTGGAAPGSIELASRTFIRFAGIHIEHGNRFDCDNLFEEASLDMMRRGRQPCFPLGSCMERRFTSRLPRLDYRGFSSSTPWPLLRTVMGRHGLSGGLRIISRYYATAFGLVAESFRRSNGRLPGREARMATLNSPLRTFHRLYLDRSIAFLAAVVWTLLTPVGLFAAKPLWLAGSGFVALAFLATLASGNRYGSAPSAACRRGAQELMEDSGVKTVILGHSHAPADVPIDNSGRRYLNSGAFLEPTPEGYPYVLVAPTEQGQRATLRHHIARGAHLGVL